MFHTRSHGLEGVWFRLKPEDAVQVSGRILSGLSNG